MNRIDQVIALLDTYSRRPEKNTLALWMDDIAAMNLDDEAFGETMHRVRVECETTSFSSLPAIVKRVSREVKRDLRRKKSEQQYERQLEAPMADEELEENRRKVKELLKQMAKWNL